MLHELQVHQTELEMQNEELRRVHAELDLARARTFDLYDLAPVGLCTLSKQGVIQQANLTAATMLGAARGALVKQLLSRFILKEHQDTFYLHLKRLLEPGGPQSCELQLLKGDGTELQAQLESVAAQDADGKLVFRVALIDARARKGT
ncbi:MAG TPA: PAS domain-containing protein [Holophagaceae bacterium]|nr:PAS domain-containing protein [Holophagaceae bacterium]